MTYSDEPELAGFEAGDGRPLRGPALRNTFRVLVVLGLVGLVLPGILTTVAVGAATAAAVCAGLVPAQVPSATGSSARWELFGPGGIGWECYSVGAFGGDVHVASLGLIPGRVASPPPLPHP